MRPDPTSLFRQAHAAWEAGDLRAAAALCDELLAQRRNDFNGLMLRANIAGAQGSASEEIGYVTAAVKVKPKDARLRTHLGQRFIVVADHAKAMVQFEKALRLEPGLEPALIGQAQVHEGKGRYDAARRLLAPLARRATPSPGVAAVFMRVQLHDGEVDEAIALGRAVMDAGHPPGLDLRNTCFTLAKAYERRGDYVQAFATAAQAQQIARAPFDPEMTRRQFDRIIATFTPGFLASAPRPARPSETPIFIIGMPRSGSTLVERIIHAHPDAHGAGELDIMLSVIRSIPSDTGAAGIYPQCVPSLTPQSVEQCSRDYLEQLARIAPRARRVANKYLGHFMHLGLINLLFPAARIVHCRRDPLDNCLSCFMERLSPSQAPFAAQLDTLAFQYNEYRRLMRHWRSVIDVPMLEIDYEKLVADQEGVSRALIDFCGLDWNDACLRFHEVRRVDGTISFDQVRRPMYASAVGRAERFGALLDPLRAALVENEAPEC